MSTLVLTYLRLDLGILQTLCIIISQSISARCVYFYCCDTCHLEIIIPMVLFVVILAYFRQIPDSVLIFANRFSSKLVSE